MVENYITLSLETHLFFSRIMKEHALFLEAGFPCKDHDWIQRSDYFRQQFEKLLIDVVRISNGNINSPILKSDELVTEFTIPAERRTEQLSGVPINSSISGMEENLRSGMCREECREMTTMVHRINERALRLLNGLIDLKENILREMESCRLFSFNYPLLIQHILREARLYRSIIDNLMNDRNVSYQGLFGTEEFWNQIMMEHALFIRGLLDPSEEALIDTADEFSQDYKRLLEMAKQQDRAAMQEMTSASLAETLKYRDFKAAGAKGILSCDIASIILPLLADHVLREANHYIRILQCARAKQDE
ncbi:MAG: DUF2935 domain-containing protein [Lachnospiraceae bacterium]